MKRIETYTDVLGKIILILGMFSSLFISGIYGLNIYGSIFNYALFALFIIYGVFYLISIKQQFKKNDVLFYCIIALLILNLISILLNNEKIFNLKLFIITAIQWVIFFQYGRNDKGFIIKVLEILNYVIFIITIIGLIRFLCNMTVISDNIRYCGIYANTNMGSAIMVTSIGISLMLINTKHLYKKIFLILNIIVQILLIRLCLSRASTIFMILTFAFFIISYMLLSKKKPRQLILNAILISIAICLVYGVASKGIYMIHEKVANYQQQQSIKTNDSNTNKETEPQTPTPEPEKTKSEYERDDYQKNFSNEIRLNLIKYGFLAAIDKPMFGVGQKSVADVVTLKAGKYYGGITAGGVHNTYLQIAIACGFPALLLFLIIQLLIFIRIVKRFFALRKCSDKDKICQFSALTALYLGFLVYGLFESILILNSAILTYMFALVAGGVYDEVSNV